MTDEQIVRHIHETKDARPDSIEIGTPSKGGVLKVYVNLQTMSDASRRFCAAVDRLPIINADAIQHTIFADAEPFDPAKFVSDVIGS